MSFIKISELTEKVTLAGTEEVLINDSGTSKKMATQRFLDVQTAAEAAQTAAELAETNAETAETNAAASASAASTSATNAANSASAASTSASNASASATAASNAQSAAETARDQTLSAFDDFDDRYLGTKASDPSVDNDGNALVAGALYFNSTDGEMKVYDGSQWLAAYASLSGALIATNNLSDLNNAATARTNLGLGSAATTASTDYATAAQGSTADSAVQPGDNVSDLTNDAGYLTGISGQSIEDLSDVATMTPSDGQLLTWDSSTSKWNAEDAPISLPDQTSQSGKYLTTNGTVASWDALATVANSGAYSDLSGTPTNVSTFTNDSGYITGNQTITLSGDATGSGTTSITVTVADDSHNHIISNVDGLQDALDAKQAAATALTTSTSFSGDVTGTYNSIAVTNDSHTHDTRYYTETEVGNFFSGTTAITGYNKSNWDTAYSWGNHASAGYLTGNQTITLSGDATGSGTTSISVTVANDSHSHSTSTITGLGTLATLSSVNAATITDNSVGAAELNVSGNGTSGQALTSDGDGTFSWTTISGGVSGVYDSVFTSSGTWNKPSGVNVVAIQVLGGGGAGGENNSNSIQGGGGGGGGAYAIYNAANLSNSYTVTVGSGGVGVSVSGGASSFGNIVVGNGGAGGPNNPNGGGTGGSGGNGAVNQITGLLSSGTGTGGQGAAFQNYGNAATGCGGGGGETAHQFGNRGGTGPIFGPMIRDDQGWAANRTEQAAHTNFGAGGYGRYSRPGGPGLVVVRSFK